jgi:hypothetical protein
VPAGVADRFEQELAQLVREPAQLAFLELAQLVGIVDRVE